MLYWEANFQIKDSDVQAAEIFAFAEQEENNIIVNFFADSSGVNFLFSNKYAIESEIDDCYEYLISLEDFSQYKKI